jgi:hypothetical protein
VIALYNIPLWLVLLIYVISFGIALDTALYVARMERMDGKPGLKRFIYCCCVGFWILVAFSAAYVYFQGFRVVPS